MHFSYVLLLNLSTGVLAITTKDHTATITTSVTEANFAKRHPSITKRADSVATVTLGPKESYTASLAKDAPTPAEDKFLILPAGDDGSDGVDFVFGEKLQKKIEDTCNQKCKDHDAGSADCVSAVKELIPTEEMAVQKRALFLVTAATVAVALQTVVTGIIALIGAALGALAAYHLPKSNIDQAATPTAASSLAFVTDPKAKPTNIGVEPGDVLEVPTIEPGDNGGILIKSTEDLASRTRDYLNQHSNGGQKCPGPSDKRSLDASLLHKRIPELTPEEWACLLEASAIALGAIVTTFQEWYRTRLQRGVNIEPRGGGALVLVDRLGRQVANQRPREARDDEVWRRALIMATNHAYYQSLIRKPISSNMEMTLEIKDCPPKDWFVCDSPLCKGKDNKCADGSALEGCECEDRDDDASQSNCPSIRPPCDICGGDAGDSKCGGIWNKERKTILQGCECWAADEEQPLYESEEEMKDYESVLAKLPDLPKNPPPPYDGPVNENGEPIAHCELRRDLDGRGTPENQVAVETDLFKSLIQKTVCKDYPGDPSKSFDQTLTRNDADDKYKDLYHGWTFEFKWIDQPGACKPEQTCQAIFESFLHSETDCSRDSHTMARTGTYDLNCGSATYIITPAPASSDPPKPPPTPRDDCPEPYPEGDGKDDVHKKWWDNNKCNKKCPGEGKDKKYECTPGWNDSLRLCSCKEQSCKDAKQDLCSDPDKKNPF